MKKRQILILIFIIAILFTSCNEESHEEDGLIENKSTIVIVPWSKHDDSSLVMYDLKPILEEKLGEEVIIKHVPGTSEAIALEYFYDLEIEDNVFFLASESLVLLEDLNLSNLGYEDFIEIKSFMSPVNLILVAADSPYPTYESLLINIKESPGKINMLYKGLGTSGHLNGIRLKNLGYNINMSLMENEDLIEDKLLKGEGDFIIESYRKSKEYIDNEEVIVLAVIKDTNFPLLPKTELVYNRIDGFKVDYPFYYPKSFLAKKNMKSEEIEKFKLALEESLEDERWTQIVEENGYINLSDETINRELFWEEYINRYLDLLSSEGIISIDPDK